MLINLETNYKQQLLEKINTKTAKIGVIGMGYVGLPLAIEFAKKDFQVLGFDVDTKKVATLNDGKSHILDVPTAEVAIAKAKKCFEASSDFAALNEVDIISICVPTPLTASHEPDMSYVKTAVASITQHMKRGTLIVLESTTYPGTTRELIADELEKAGDKVGTEVFVCFSPERIDPGNTEFDSKDVPKVVGGITSDCVMLGRAYYSQVFKEVVPVSTTEVAEMTKLLENTFRSVNIAFINEMAVLCEKLGIDLWEVIGAAKTKPFGFMPFYPGPGVGGHCIPLDPMYLYWKGKEKNHFSRFIELAQQINTAMPTHVTQIVSNALNKKQKSISGARLLIVGVAYKSDIDDVRESPALEVYEELKQLGANIEVYDPFVASFRDAKNNKIQTNSKLTNNHDAIVIMTKHSNIDYTAILENNDCIIDTRNIWNEKYEHVHKIGSM
ncbi:nucleotide sugar dehydrogenase [Listeria booriae]|uniref:nucleotide sugar dehydrogenase n=1 Tax=Listeria booriae TaxID=1552123 RepID=UPI0016247D8B|nr:nucleotide sugar dehydrogenase [Listeria booriae]MBC2160842.1 nucleotide sugar dehydrogenase [Listeria booriae]